MSPGLYAKNDIILLHQKELGAAKPMVSKPTQLQTKLYGSFKTLNHSVQPCTMIH